ncbi:MAG: hypothetical protein NC819_02400 [Candidatus Omnitrophica bacterium]|nr:hypothetical protein [Candidatus Omnitrophota bacterium]
MHYTPAQAMEAINAAFLALPREEVKRLLVKKDSLSIRHGMTMRTEKGHLRVIDVQLRPWLADRRQRRFFHRCCLLLKGALSRVMPMYLADPRVRTIVPLDPREHDWLLAANRGGLQKPQTVIDRLDATAVFTAANWTDFWFLEPNSVGIGGVHYIPAARELTEEWILPIVKKRVPGLRLQVPDDIRHILTDALTAHAKAIGRKLKRLVFIEDQSEPGGTEEFPSLVRYFKRFGIEASTADPRQVEFRQGELTVKGKVIDLFYRDTEITEMLEMARIRKGTPPFEGMRRAFMENRVVSSIAGEFDHKSTWELFTNPLFSRRFSLRQRRLFRDHILWTRLLGERRTEGPLGRQVDLVPFIRKNKQKLVLKPNREFGGEGVVFGNQVTQAVWEKELHKAMKKPSHHVIQSAAPVRAELFPVASPNGRVKLKAFFVVSGFAVSPTRIAILGRSSQESVVNVSRRGGLVAAWLLP